MCYKEVWLPYFIKKDEFQLSMYVNNAWIYENMKQIYWKYSGKDFWFLYDI